ncbi:MAG TPA: MFS transporter [Candidatus Nanopelagicales bacterium]|nr:MFS transporter [Candidatus Nanopelagicales bacterium]
MIPEPMDRNGAPAAAEPLPAPSPTARPVQGWRSLLVVYGIVSTIEALGVAQVFAFLPLRLREVGLPDDQIPTFTGLFTSLIFVFGIVLVPFWGVWADKYSRRAVIARSAVVEVFVFAGVALAQEPWQLAASLLLVGLQLGNTGVMLAALRDVTPRHRVGTVTALFGATGPLGFAIGPVLGALIVDGLGLPLVAVFWLGAALSLAAVVLLLVASREIRPAVVPEGSALSLARRAISGVFSDAAVRRIFAIFGVSILANQMSRPYLPLLVEDVNGGRANIASAIGLVTGTAALVGALISPLAGPLGDRVGFRRVLAGALLGAGTMLLLMPLAPGVAALAGIAVVYAALQASTQAMVFGLVAVEVAPERRSATLNLVLLPLYMAGIVGPTIGAVAASVGGIGAPFIAAGLVFLAGGVAVAFSLWRANRPA